jgi:hypothetical protein
MRNFMLSRPKSRFVLALIVCALLQATYVRAVVQQMYPIVGDPSKAPRVPSELNTVKAFLVFSSKQSSSKGSQKIAYIVEKIDSANIVLLLRRACADSSWQYETRRGVPITRTEYIFRERLGGKEIRLFPMPLGPDGYMLLYTNHVLNYQGETWSNS